MTTEVTLCFFIALAMFAFVIMLPVMFRMLDMVLDQALAEAGWSLPGEDV